MANVNRVRGCIRFVIVWLFALYIYEVAREAHWFAGVGAVVVAVLVNVYARRKAAACIQPTPMFYLWLYAPVVVLFGLPLVLNVARVLSGEQEIGWWSSLQSLLPFLLKIGVPAGTLLWVYVALGSGRDDRPG